jgi:hypothetical protein
LAYKWAQTRTNARALREKKELHGKDGRARGRCQNDQTDREIRAPAQSSFRFYCRIHSASSPGPVAETEADNVPS